MDPMLARAQLAFDARFAAMGAANDSSGPRTHLHLVRMGGQAAIEAHLKTLSAAERGRFLMSVDPSSVHVNTPLPNVSIMYKNRDMIADDVMPVVRVQKRSDLYWKYDPSMGFYLMKTDMGGQLGQPGQASPSYTTSNYSVTDHALRDYVPQSVLDNADTPIAPLVDTTTNLNMILRLARENRVALQAFNVGNFGPNTSALSGSARWDTATGLPIANIQTAIALCTMYPTIAAIGEQSFMAFINNPEVKGFFTSRAATSMGATPFFMDAEVIGKALGLKKFLVGRAKYNSAPDGESASIASNWIWGKSLALLHIPEVVGVRCAAFGVTFRFVGERRIGGIVATGEFLTRSWFAQDLGAYGAHAVQVSHSDTEVNIDSSGATGYCYATVTS